MNLWVKIGIGTLCGFGGGFLAGFFTYKKMNDVKFEEVSAEEMKEIEEKVNAAKYKAEAAAPKVPSSDIPKDLPQDVDKAKMVLQGKTPYARADEEQKMAYEKLWAATKDYSNEENANELPTMKEEEFSEDEENDDAYVLEDRQNDFVEPPHVIGLADFYNDRPEYDKVTIKWFEGDNTWVDENEEIIPDIKSYIGMEVKDLFASNSPEDDPDVRFVRNDRYGSDYEIERHHMSFREAVGGVG